jgi:hypothetical protein
VSDFGSSQIYTIELWSSNGVIQADISALAHNRSYTLQRNEAESLTFELDLYAFETYCSGIGVDPKTILNPYTTDVKVKRNGTYLFGSQVIAATIQIGTDYTMASGTRGGGASSFSPTISVTCSGYLNLFKDRYLTYTYNQQDASFIAGDVLTQAQSATNGSVGVTIAAGNYLTGKLRDRTYTRQNIKTELQNLTQLVDGRFDFVFDSNKVFYTYQQIGSKRTDVQFTFGGPQGNIIGLYDERSGANIYNEIIGLGSGFGADQLISTQDDSDSQRTYFLRQDIKQYNSVVDQSTLDQNAKADLALEKDILEIPQITISGKELANTNFLSVGDRVPINIVGHPFLSNLNGIYRIEKMLVNIDDNDFENDITLYFDNFAVDPSS